MRGRRRASSPLPKALEKPLKQDNVPEVMRRLGCEGLALNQYIEQVILSNPFVPPKGDRCPINDLPNELLAHIFWIGTFTDEESDDEDDMYQEEDDEVALLDDIKNGMTPRNLGEEHDDRPLLPFQILVSHVCQHWREVAIEAPVLWTAIKFSADVSPFTRCKTWIERSKSLPIDITIDCTVPCDGDHDGDTDTDAMTDCDDDDDDDDDDEDMSCFTLNDLELIFSLITPHVARWRGLEIMVNSYHYMHFATHVLATLPSAPTLEVLQLYHYEDMDVDEYEVFHPAKLRDPFPALFSGNAPKLSHIALWGVHIAWSVDTNTFLMDLKDLELAYHTKDVRPSWEEFERILLGSPGLDTLTLCLSGPSGGPSDWDPKGTIDLLELRTLMISYHTPKYISHLLTLLNIPNVTTLALDFEEDDFTSFARQLATPRPGTSKSLLKGLEHLKISGLPCDHAVVDVMYAQLGNLRSINLTCTFLDEVFFTKLAKPIPPTSGATATMAATTFYCPNLDTVTTSGIGGREIRRFVEARKNAGMPVKRVFMSEEDELDDEDEAWLRGELETFDLFEPSDEESDGEYEDDMDMD